MALNKKKSSLNEDLIDSSSESSSSAQRLKIDIDDEDEGQSNKADSENSEKVLSH